MIVVSHDRYFLNRVCTHTLAFEGDGVVTINAGGYDYYLEKRAAAVRLAKSEAAAPVIPPRTAAAPKTRKLNYKESRELETIEADIHAAEAEVAALNTLLAAPDFYAKHGDEWHTFEAKLKAARDRVAKLFLRWEELEAIKAGRQP